MITVQLCRVNSSSPYEARDLYCIRPGCECRAITVRFFEDSGTPLGEVFLDAETGQWSEPNDAAEPTVPSSSSSTATSRGTIWPRS